jgi:ATP-dependent helicase/nuclease subunit B
MTLDYRGHNAPYNPFVTSRPPLISNELLTLPAANTIVLSPSDRARRAFAYAWALDAQRASGRDAAIVPRFMTIKSWFATLWEEAQLFGLIDDTRELISPLVEAALWRHIASEVANASSVESATLAERFAEAWMLEQGYRSANEPVPYAPGVNGELYRAARKTFVERLRIRNAITADELPNALANVVSNIESIANQHLVITPEFYGRISAKSFASLINKNSQKALINGANVFGVGKISSNTTSRRIACIDVNDERANAIAWAAQTLRRESRDATHSRIAIVVPDLHRTRGTWERALRDADLPFNLSLGLPVSKYPWAAAGFTLVSALFTSMPPETIAQALRHPRWGRDEASIAAIGRREIELLQRGEAETTLFDFCNAPNAAMHALQERIQPLRSLFRSGGAGSVANARAHWRGVFERAIAAFVESSAPLDSQTFQLRDALIESIDQWQSLDAWLPSVTVSVAQQELIAITDQAAFQPEGSDAPLQVIGLLESAGVPFDAMWITGLSERVLPEGARANPFLTAHWQRERRAGLASIDECDERAARLVAGWQMLSGETIASLPRKIDDEPQLWSPLVANWQTINPVKRHASLDTTNALETIDDETAPAWRPSDTTSRGVSALEAQANCPRRGFAQGRLRLSAWPTRSDGLSPQVRGELVHRVAEKIGRELQTHPMDFEHIRRELATQIDAAIVETRAVQRNVPAHVWNAEHTRLARVFSKLLDVESQRPEFAVMGVEEKAKTSLGALNFSLRLDRIDQVARVDTETGEVATRGLAVIDFKSGNVNRKSVFDERLTAPQLPLYAHALGFDNIDAVAYARVSDDEQSFVSFGTATSGFEANKRGGNKAPAWDELLHEWKTKLALLANELIEGEAVLAPAYGKKTCERCDFQRFCRVDFRQFVESVDDANAEGES